MHFSTPVRQGGPCRLAQLRQSRSSRGKTSAFRRPERKMRAVFTEGVSANHGLGGGRIGLLRPWHGHRSRGLADTLFADAATR
ncbi:hypothetical protein MRX96_047439 [Rhipicephalus microplus]